MKRQVPIIKCFGGKSYLCQWIISHFPKNYREMKYVEGFAGGANVLLNKEKSEFEVLSDLDKAIYYIYMMAVEFPQDLQEEINKIDYSEHNFSVYKDSTPSNPMDIAVREIVVRRMSRGGMGKNFAWSDRARGGQPGDVNAWKNFQKGLSKICERLENVSVVNQPAMETLSQFDSDEFLIYLDPPYMPSTRRSTNVYNKEMSEKDHRDLLEKIVNHKAKILISGYFNPVYSKALRSWKMHVKDMPNHSSQARAKERRLECLWTNF